MKLSKAVIHGEDRTRHRGRLLGLQQCMNQAEIFFDMFLAQQNLHWNYGTLHVNLKVINQFTQTQKSFPNKTWKWFWKIFPPSTSGTAREVFLQNMDMEMWMITLKILLFCAFFHVNIQQDQFSLYALYSKNKPKSDTLLASHGNSFFRVSNWIHTTLTPAPFNLIHFISPHGPKL